MRGNICEFLKIVLGGEAVPNFPLVPLEDAISSSVSASIAPSSHDVEEVDLTDLVVENDASDVLKSIDEYAKTVSDDITKGIHTILPMKSQPTFSTLACYRLYGH